MYSKFFPKILPFINVCVYIFIYLFIYLFFFFFQAIRDVPVSFLYTFKLKFLGEFKCVFISQIQAM
jgi:hypothetical protein